MAEQQNNQPIHVNVFLKGMMQDLDINKIPREYYITGEDIKLLDKEGQGYVVTNVDGNEYAFSLSVDFIPLGSREHKDIMYIASCNKNGLGTGEIGTFPSLNPDTLEWELQYRPLRNFTKIASGGSQTHGTFRTDLFQFFLENRIEIEIKDSFDGSANIYFADGYNQLRVINTGFTSKGKFTFDPDVTPYPYTTDNFETKVNLVLGTDRPTIVEINSITTGGALKYGNYIFFVKYLTENLDETYYIAESDPIAVFRGLSTVSSVQGGKASDNSDKKVTLDISGIDSSYSYVKIGYIRHFSDFNGIPTYEFAEVDNRFEIDPAQDTLTVDIVGTEGTLFVEEEEFLLEKDTEVIPKTITQLNNRLWGGNWKKTETHNEALARFAKLIKIGYDITTDPSAMWSLTTNSDFGQYKDAKNYDTVGYFRGEAYPFGVVFELNDGTMSNMYPVTGVDMFNNLTPSYTIGGADDANEDGIFRFPNARLVPHINGTNLVQFLAPKFDTEDAWLSVMGANENNWIRFNVRAIYFVRGDRYKNLQYQGLMMGAAAPFLTSEGSYYPLTRDCSLGTRETQPEQINPANFPSYSYFQMGYNWDDATANPYSATHDNYWGHWAGNIVGQAFEDFDASRPPREKWGPVFRGYAPAAYKVHGPEFNDDDNGKGDRCYTTRFFLQPDKYCFYSPDMLFNAFNSVDACNYVWRVGKTIQPRPTATNDNPGIWTTQNNFNTAPYFYRTDMYGQFVNQTARMSPIDQKVMVGEGGFIRPGDEGSLDFINSAEEPYADANQYWYWKGDDALDDSYWQWYNRSMRMAKYLGINLSQQDLSGTTLGNEDYNLDVVNIYNVDPDSITITNLFANINALKFKKISDAVVVSDVVDAIVAASWDGYKEHTAWRGDCFLQRTYFKQMYSAGSSLHFSIRQRSDWDDTDLPDRIDGFNSNAVRWAHGLVIGVITENEHNTAMRSENGLNEYYPAVTDAFEFSAQVYNTNNAESFALNYGYDQTLSTNYFLAYDPNLPESTLHYSTRIKYSDPTVPGSFVDAYRSFRVNNYVDFETDYGEIHRIEEVFGRLVSIQEDAISEHYVNERITQNADEGSPVLGYGEVLSKNSRRMANFGTQHQWSIVKGDTLYGVDWKRQVIWEVGMQRSDSGSLYLDAKDISQEKFIKKWMRETVLQISSGRSDVVNYYGDNTMNGEGIVSGFDKNTGDVYFIFHKRVENI